MPRSARLHVPGGYYHVVLRGNHREVLFGTAADRQFLNDIVADAISRHRARVHAFCWMSNHLHALLQIAHSPLGGLMQSIAMRYARYRHKKLRTTGHLFERRYRARLVETDDYFLAVLRYIHLNPVAARIVTDPARYRWSSHRAYLGTDTPGWITTEFGLSLFSSDPLQARISYAQFVSENVANPDELVQMARETGAGLGGRTGAPFPTKPAVAPYRPDSSSALQELAERICHEHHIGIERLRSLSRARELTPTRVDFITQAINLRMATLAELARFLHRDPSALTKLLARHPHPSQTRS
jgi:putative transposase